MSEEIVRVLRVLEYIGPRSWVETTVARSIHGTLVINTNKETGAAVSIIRAGTIGEFPDVLDAGEILTQEELELKRRAYQGLKETE